MESTPSSPYWLAGVGLIFAFMSYRAIVTKKVGSGPDARTSSQPSYYLFVAGYMMAALAMFFLAGIHFHQQYGLTALVLFVVSIVGIFTIIHQFRKIARGILMQLKYLFRKRPKPPGPSPRSWAMASVAFLSKIQGKDYYLLGGAEPSEKRAKWAKRKLKREWEVLDEEDFDEIQDWLFEVGHRTEFRELIDKVKPMTAEQREQFVEAELAEIKNKIDAEEFEHRIDMIVNNTENVRNIGFMAWDLLRFIDFCRLGYLAGYMDEQETWERVFSAAQVLQSRFDSWTELMDNYFAGREFWSVVETKKDTKVYQKAYQKLQDDKKSPWNRIPWDAQLYRQDS